MTDDDTTAQHAQDARLQAAFARYQATYGPTKAGTTAASELSRARLDLGLLLDALGEELPALVRTQLQLDGEALLREVSPLPDPD
jgi:hypothetical protein